MDLKEYGPNVPLNLRILTGGYLIMQTLGLVVLSLVLTNFIACATAPTSKSLKGYVSRFERIFNRKVNYPVVFKNDFDPQNKSGIVTIGACYKLYGNPLNIEINKREWRNLAPEQRTLLLFHEMAHCTLHLEHRDNKFRDGCPVYTMNSVMPNGFCIAKYGVNYYINSIKTQISRSYRRRQH